MCGIAGWISYNGEVKARQTIIEKMTDTTTLRVARKLLENI
jgi:asparagine synthetase B (glutamine-hydrolysing)